MLALRSRETDGQVRTRDDLLDALDRLPRPVTFEETPITMMCVFSRDHHCIIATADQEHTLIREYFESLPADEKYTP